MTLDEMLTRVQGAIDLIRGRREVGWRRLDISADGFWNSFLAIPLCLPPLLVIWVAHAQWLAASGAEFGVGSAVLSMMVIELASWVLSVALIFLMARLLGFSDRAVPTVIAANWASVVFAFVQAIPSVLALLFGTGDGLGFISLVVLIGVLVALWRLLAAALERPAPTVGALFVASLVLGYAFTSAARSALGLMPDVA